MCVQSQLTLFVYFGLTQCISQRWSSLWASRWPAIESTCTRLSTGRYGELAALIHVSMFLWSLVLIPFNSLGHKGWSTRFSTLGWRSTWWWLCWWGWPGSASPPDRRQTTLNVREWENSFNIFILKGRSTFKHVLSCSSSSGYLLAMEIEPPKPEDKSEMTAWEDARRAALLLFCTCFVF